LIKEDSDMFSSLNATPMSICTFQLIACRGVTSQEKTYIDVTEEVRERTWQYVWQWCVYIQLKIKWRRACQLIDTVCIIYKFGCSMSYVLIFIG